MSRGKSTKIILYLLLLSPLLGYFYKVTLSQPKTILHLYIFIVFILGIVFLIRNKNIVFPKFLWFLLLYGIYRFIWLQIAEVEDRRFVTQVYYAIFNFSTLLFILMIYNTDFTQKFIKRIVFWVKLTVIFAVIASIMQVFDYGFLNAWEYFDEGSLIERSLYTQRRSSIFGYLDQNGLGLSYLPLGSVLIGFLLLTKEKSYLPFTVLIGISAVLSNTRFIIVSFIIILIMYLIYFKLNIAGIFKYTVIAVCFLVIIYSSLDGLGYNFDDFIAERLLPEGSIDETTRYKAFETFMIFFPRKVLFGTGYYLTDEIAALSWIIAKSSRIHVGYLSHLVSYGLVGSILLFGFWYKLAKYLYNNAKKSNYWGALFAFLIFFWAQVTLVNYSIFFPGLMFALVFDKYYQDNFSAVMQKKQDSTK